MAEICGKPGGLVGTRRRRVTRSPSATTAATAFPPPSEAETLTPIRRRDQDHGGPPPPVRGDQGTGHGDDGVLDVATGKELARADTCAGIQSVLCPAPGPRGDV